MKTLLQKILHKISLSTHQGKKVSTSRVQSFIILIPILVFSFSYLIFGYISFIFSLYKGIPFVISTESIVIFGMLLSHHLALVFSRRSSQSIEEIKGQKKDSIDEIESDENVEEN